MPAVGGFVFDSAGAPVDRELRLYRRDTGGLLDKARSSGGNGDPHFDKVSLLLHMDGANGRTTFTDSSATPKTVTAVGDAKISTAQSKFGGASGYFDGVGAYLTVPYSSGFAFDAGEFCVEHWVFPESGNPSICDLVASNSAVFPGNGWAIRLRTGDKPIAGLSTSGSDYIGLEGTITIPLNTWAHLALVRVGNTASLYVNGLLSVSATITGSQNNTNDPIFIGKNGAVADSTWNFKGYIDDVRITKGVARYTANFTPPTEPFPNASLAYALSGTVTGSTGSPVARAIRAQREDTGAYVGGTISNATTGAYTIPTEHPGEHTVVAYPVTGDGLPALVHHGVIPV